MKNIIIKNIKIIIIIMMFLSFLTIYFVPFTNVNNDREGEFRYCRYRLAVYEFYFYGSDESPRSDTYIGNIIFTKKIGGPLEYFGLKEIKKLKNSDEK